MCLTLYDKEQSIISSETKHERTTFIVERLFLPFVREMIINRLISNYLTSIFNNVEARY